MYWFLNFLAVVFKKQEISQQVVTRVQDLAFEFSQISRGWYPGLLQREGANPAPHTQPGLWPGAREQAPRCWNPNLGPLNFSAAVQSRTA